VGQAFGVSHVGQTIVALGGMLLLLGVAFAALVGTLWLILALFRHVPLVGRRRR
jgi:hypothetical protein